MAPHASTRNYLVTAFLILVLSGISNGQHLADPNFKPQVEHPAL
jgi:hypothetical protein